MQGFQLPGALWSALLVALPLLAAWLDQFFPGAIWAAPVAGLLLIAAKVIAVLREPEPVQVQMPPGAAGDMLPPVVRPSKATRIAWGG